MFKLSHPILFILALLALLSPAYAQAPAPAATKAPSGNRLKTTIYPIYAWTPVFGADIKLPEIPNPPPCDGCGNGGPIIPGGNVSSGLSGAAFFGFTIEKGRIKGGADFLYAGMEAESARPVLTVKASTKLGGAQAGFKVANDFWVTGGVRRYALDIRAKALIFDEVQWEPGLWEPTVGAAYEPQLTPTWKLFAKADYGGIGQDHHSTSTGTARLEWQPAKHFALTFGYGFFHLDVKGQIRSRDIHFTQTLHGPIVGIGIPF